LGIGATGNKRIADKKSGTLDDKDVEMNMDISTSATKITYVPAPAPENRAQIHHQPDQD
jgi:hypothetical protein